MCSAAFRLYQLYSLLVERFVDVPADDCRSESWILQGKFFPNAMPGAGYQHDVIWNVSFFHSFDVQVDCVNCVQPEFEEEKQEVKHENCDVVDQNSRAGFSRNEIKNNSIIDVEHKLSFGILRRKIEVIDSSSTTINKAFPRELAKMSKSTSASM